MAEISGIEAKFTVIKNDDIKKHLDERDKSELSRILWKIGKLRYEEGKEAENTYLVVNVDEPYSPEIINIMKVNDHWGHEHDSNQVKAEFDGNTLVLPEGER